MKYRKRRKRRRERRRGGGRGGKRRRSKRWRRRRRRREREKNRSQWEKDSRDKEKQMRKKWEKVLINSLLTDGRTDEASYRDACLEGGTNMEMQRDKPDLLVDCRLFAGALQIVMSVT